MIHQFAHNMKESILTRCFVIGYSCFDKMSRTVQFMIVGKVCPAIFRLHNRIIRVQITVWLLGPGHQINQVIGPFFPFWIGMCGQAIGHRFQPLGHIAVLEYHSVILSPFLTGGDPQIPDG